MSVVPARIAVVASLAVFAGSVCAVRRMLVLRRALDAERAARRLAAGLHEQDLAAFTVLLNAAVYAQGALSQADLVLDTALADVDLEGGSW